MIAVTAKFEQSSLTLSGFFCAFLDAIRKNTLLISDELDQFGYEY
jgi:hypothetical protein